MNYKNRIQRNIEKLPFGSKVILPCVKYIYNSLNIRSKYNAYYKKTTESKEAKEILKACKSDQIKEIVVIYDLYSSAPTYGDFFYVVMLSRFFTLFNKKIHLWIVDSEFRQDAVASLSVNERLEFVRSIIEIPQILLNSGETVDIKTVTWTQVTSLLSHYQNQDSAFICFENMVTHRKSFYQYSFNIINMLLKFSPEIDREQFLLSADSFRTLNIDKPTNRYITWSLRFTNKWDCKRNLTEDEFVLIYDSLKRIFPEHKIMAVSDETGCAYFKEISNNKNMELLYSKDFSQSFLGDSALILYSDYFFTVRGGGISSIPMFSKMPYGIIAKSIHETVTHHRKITSWSTENQVFIFSDRGLPEDVLCSQ